MSVEVIDAPVRQQALDCSQSFIVQAPAGSGKTGLISQRFLALLAYADNPEEIVAITFTRKAAAEMQERILKALSEGEDDTPPEAEHDRNTWALARKALARDAEQGWQLLDNPGRLRIQTIDSLCTSLARQMPLLSGFGATPAISEDAEALYRDAAIRTIDLLEGDGAWSDDIAFLVRHLDNQLEHLKNLVMTMLARRDQWLRHVVGASDLEQTRETLECALGKLVDEQLAALQAAVPVHLKDELIAVARFAADNIRQSGIEKAKPILACLDMTELPGSDEQGQAAWAGLALLLQTDKGDWRKTVNKNTGFPAPGDAGNAEEKALFSGYKQRAMELLKALAAEDSFGQQLAQLKLLPEAVYSDQDWRALQALFTLLKLATAQLKVVFRERGQVDFAELAHAANLALGEPDEPTDLALALDYRINHILVDEFQDTSFMQYGLLERLTAGWQTGDGHTLFVVGDPMQSIYRFREAEVGRFLSAWEQGIGSVALQPLRLSVNFRSQQGIIDWVNNHFPNILPQQQNIEMGAVSYAASESFKAELDGPAVTVHPQFGRDDEAEAAAMLALVREAGEDTARSTTAILVRSRSHLADVVLTLKEAGLRFRAVEIERLTHRPVVQDILALTRAISHIGDRVAWLSVLRAPFVGLSLVDIHTLVSQHLQTPVIDVMNQAELVEKLSADGRQRLARALPLLNRALEQRGRSSLRQLIETLWLMLGGPACITEATDLEDADVVFQLLTSLNDAGDINDYQELLAKINKLFALPDVHADESIQLMTIHKSKGLEFDTVILPGLARTPRGDSTRLLYWLERTGRDGDTDLLLAPITARGDDKNRLAAWIEAQDKQKGRYEDGRLLYVAVTRAKQRLHLLGHVELKESKGDWQIRPPSASTLLSAFWGEVEHEYIAALEQQARDEVEAEAEQEASGERLRLAGDWQLPQPPATLANPVDAIVEAPNELVEFSWASETARHTGTVVHRLLQAIGEQGIDKAKAPADYEAIIRVLLLRNGVLEEQLDAATDKVTRALQNVLANERARWILAEHRNGSCELALTGQVNGKARQMVIDRTFIDDEGTRWVIDYKTGEHEGGGLEDFLDREQERYQGQLDQYARLMRLLGDEPVRCALYFPMNGGWREWE